MRQPPPQAERICKAAFSSKGAAAPRGSASAGPSEGRGPRGAGPGARAGRLGGGEGSGRGALRVPTSTFQAPGRFARRAGEDRTVTVFCPEARYTEKG